jgi:hypothetical protein
MKTTRANCQMEGLHHLTARAFRSRLHLLRAHGFAWCTSMLTRPVAWVGVRGVSNRPAQATVASSHPPSSHPPPRKRRSGCSTTIAADIRTNQHIQRFREAGWHLNTNIFLRTLEFFVLGTAPTGQQNSRRSSTSSTRENQILQSTRAGTCRKKGGGALLGWWSL